ncbi:MAG: hypothetical protein A3K19_26875 [Lentisphaerae bacterium RIFOXYB12_FULL_65_16]|nr:MAG: hypothetical protein A3K18_23850 [Lentisphaerae bacterium RIFOXYA12_64_32]OGV88023.1 MAG: hypothetical protein A3K19_26875 [Lentisphaerae bacterium RIFOXYB12_FULL_65_16]
MDFISIDQNSHSLWDTIPKLQAVAVRGWRGIHCVEDVDVAFTRRGAAGADSRLELVLERCYRGGVSDWGATLFYTEFLGRQPFDVRQLEPYTGWTTAALSRRLGVSVDELYDRYSVSDNWQLVGSSYAEDDRHHRVIGDLRLAEIAPFVLELLAQARRNMEFSFPEPEALARLAAWFSGEEERVRQLLQQHEGGRLVDLYASWVQAHVPAVVQVGVTSGRFSIEGERAEWSTRLLRAFIADYSFMAGCYNQALAEAELGLNALDQARGELPFFAVLRRDGRMVRVALALEGDRLVAGALAWKVDVATGALPLDDMSRDGVVCVPGKAVLLVLQARLAPHGAALVLPYRGSVYMPAARAFERRLRESGRLPDAVLPLCRVKFNFIEHWRGCHTLIRLPRYLCEALGGAELKADRVAEALPDLAAQARAELEQMRTPQGRDALAARLFGSDLKRRRELEARRRELAADPGTRSEAGRVWDIVKEVDRRMLERQTERAVRNLRLLDLDFCNSRGALLPWSIALGGQEFYDRLIADAEVYEEPA